ncbi:uncharacterized protein LOC120660004 isoform X1 [Panicum virgatum]|uniref:Uncharacterized protein n=1 Tax=Panicum virgatum TaxID=38727 RepID=A0A8T0VA34_PANVG|nr:uncharacterized protein LOC120660004 isoform X1 [Panicum virgatum]KAG2633601.1 hypothetical protein PVAP13_2NG235900 [Panicum virgatum]
MSLAPPPPSSPRLRAFRRDGTLSSAGRFPSITGCLSPRSTPRSCGRAGRAYCLFSGGDNRKKQDEARKALENALGQKKAEFDKWDVEIKRRRQRGQPGGPAAGGGGWSGGGRWFRWLTSGGFWDAAKQIVLTILGIIAAFFLIANFNVLVAAVINSLLLVLRTIRRTLSFIARCVFQDALVERPGPKSSTLDNSNVGAVPVKGRAGMSATERVVKKWRTD